MRWFDKKLTKVCEFILKKLCWKNTKFNQQFISNLLGMIVGWTIIIIMSIK